MTPAEAARGRELLDAYNSDATGNAVGGRLDEWLWANREALVRCAEEAAEVQGAPTCNCPGCCSRGERACHRAEGAPLECKCGSFNGLPHARDCPARAAWLRAQGAPKKPEQET